VGDAPEVSTQTPPEQPTPVSQAVESISQADVQSAVPTTTIDVTRLTPLFKLVFLTVTGLTVLAFAVNMVLVLVMNEPSAEAKSFLELCSTISKMGFAAIVGLVGGKAI
jgi:hypothetical protein